MTGAMTAIRPRSGRDVVVLVVLGAAGILLDSPDHHRLYAGSYPDDDLRRRADRIREWAAQGREMSIDFSNDGHRQAVRNAENLRGMLRC
jgi:uncharacterized protein YecE (DUF72 family)